MNKSVDRKKRRGVSLAHVENISVTKITITHPVWNLEKGSGGEDNRVEQIEKEKKSNEKKEKKTRNERKKMKKEKK